MFVPCDEDGNALEEPTHHGKSIETMRELLKEYQQAKERCLFEFNEGFLLFDGLDLENNTIEDLLNDDFEYTLTATAQKQIGV